MILKSQIEWALHCCAILAGLPEGRYLSTKALAELHGLPKEYLSKALQSLSQADLVDTTLGQTMLFGQPAPRHGFGPGSDVDVQFRAIARGQDHRLVHAGLAHEIGQCTGRDLGRKGDLLAKIERCGQVIQSNGNEGHACDNRVI